MRKVSRRTALRAEGAASTDPTVGACLECWRASKEDDVADSSEEESELLERSERSRNGRPDPIGPLTSW